MFDRRLITNFDWILFLLVVVIALIGVAAIYSASQGYQENTQYWLRQLFWLGGGILIGVVVLLVDFRTIGAMAYYIHGAVVFSLLVLIILKPGVGTHGVNRWFMVGPVAVQPSEFIKLSMVLAVAYYFRNSGRGGNLGLKELFWPLLIVMVPFALIVNQPDLGTALLLVLVFLPMVILAGVKPRLLLIGFILGILAIAAVVASFQFGAYQVDESVIRRLQKQGLNGPALRQVESLKDQRYFLSTSLNSALEEANNGLRDEQIHEMVEEAAFQPFISKILRPYQQRRLVTFLNPENDPLGSGYHIIQSKVAIGSGRFWGKGYGESTQGALNFLPARHTDFLFSIFAEEWGLVGATSLIGLYLAFTLRGVMIILQTHDRFSAFLIMGILAIITSQVVINMGMAVGMLPVVGVPLPFFSYGGSSMISLMVGVALILNIRMRRFLWS